MSNATEIVIDTDKPIKDKVMYDLSESFNARVGDNQVPLVVRFVEHSIVQRMESEKLNPFVTGFVGPLDNNDKVTAETGIAVSYHGSSNDLIGLGRVRMKLPGAMFPQEGVFYGYLGLENDTGKRITSTNICFQVLGDEPNMYIDAVPFRTELQKLLDWATAQAKSNLSGVETDWEALKKTIKAMIESGDTDLTSLKTRIGLAEDELEQYEKDLAAGKGVSQGDLDSALDGIKDDVDNAVDSVTGGLAYLNNDDLEDVNGGYTDINKLNEFKNIIEADKDTVKVLFQTDIHVEAFSNWKPHMASGLRHVLNSMYLQNSVDAIVINGDNINNGGGYDHQKAKYLLNDFATTLWSLKHSNTPIMINKGNHDNNYKDPTTFPDDYRTLPNNALLNAELGKAYGYYRKDNGNIIRNGNSAYGYLDLPNDIRIYMLDSYDTPETVDSDGYLDFNARQNSIFSQSQLQWIANTLDTNKATAFFTHNPIADTQGVRDKKTQINHDIMQALLEGFVDGSSGTINGETGIEVEYSFDKVGTIIGVFTGHTHKDNMVVNHNINYIETTCSAVYVDNSYGDARANKYGTYQEDVFDVIEIEPTKKHVTLKRYGYGDDREYDY